MPRFLNDQLTVLGRIYKFITGQVTVNDIDLEGRVQLVHDVSREAELGNPLGNGGFAQFNLQNTHAVVAGEVSSTQTVVPTSAFWATLGVDSSTHWVWLMEATIRITETLTLTEAILSIEHVPTPLPLGFSTAERITHLWNAQTVANVDAAAVDLGAFRTASDPRQVNLPAIVPNGSTIRFSSTAGGAIAAIVGQVLVQVVPKGVPPYGLY